MTEEEWLDLGINNGWCTPPYCVMHDGFALTEEEVNLVNDGTDPCVAVVRLCGNKKQQNKIFRNNKWLK